MQNSQSAVRVTPSPPPSDVYINSANPHLPVSLLKTFSLPQRQRPLKSEGPQKFQTSLRLISLKGKPRREDLCESDLVSKVQEKAGR